MVDLVEVLVEQPMVKQPSYIHSMIFDYFSHIQVDVVLLVTCACSRRRLLLQVRS